MSLQRTLNSMFTPQRKTRKAPGKYVAIRGNVRYDIDKINGLWTARTPEGVHTNSLLGDLMTHFPGFDLLRRN